MHSLIAITDNYVLRQMFDKEKSFKALPLTFDEQSLEVLESVVDIDSNRDEFGNQELYFGKLCRDKVTLVEGICIARLTPIYGSDMYCLAPRSKKKAKKTNSVEQWFDEGRLEIIGEGIPVHDVKTERPGGGDSYPNFDSLNAVLSY